MILVLDFVHTYLHPFAIKYIHFLHLLGAMVPTNQNDYDVIILSNEHLNEEQNQQQNQHDYHHLIDCQENL